MCSVQFYLLYKCLRYHFCPQPSFRETIRWKLLVNVCTALTESGNGIDDKLQCIDYLDIDRTSEFALNKYKFYLKKKTTPTYQQHQE